MPDVLTQSARTRLCQGMVTHFIVEELTLLCADLQVDAETIPGKDQGKVYWVDHLVRYFELSGRVSELIDQLTISRPNEDWRFALVGLTRTSPLVDGKTALDQLNSEIEVRKRTIRIFNISVPAVPVLIGFVTFVALLAFGVWFKATPATMGGDFNIAVAQFGEEDAQGNVKSSANGDQLSMLVLQRLQNNLKDLPSGLPSPLIWHDSMGWLQKRTSIGTVANEQEAIRRAKEIGADILIYGNFKASESSAEFVPKFVVTQALSRTDELDQIKGNHQLGNAIVMNMPLDLLGDVRARTALVRQLDKPMRLLSRLTISLLYDSLGDPRTAASVLEDEIHAEISENPNQDPNQMSGTEVLYYFAGKQYLFVQPRRLDDAQKAFEKALSINSKYTRAQVGLGSTCFYRVQEIKPPDKRLDNGLLQQCLDTYQQALDEARATSEQTIEIQALMGLGAAQRLAAEAYVFVGDYDVAGPLFIGAAESLTEAQPMIGAEEFRLRGMLHENLGDVYQEQADLKLRQANAAVAGGDAENATKLYAESKAMFAQAIQRYQACMDEAKSDRLDQFLKTRVIDGLCVPHQKRATDSLAELQKIQ